MPFQEHGVSTEGNKNGKDERAVHEIMYSSDSCIMYIVISKITLTYLHIILLEFIYKLVVIYFLIKNTM